MTTATVFSSRPAPGGQPGAPVPGRELAIRAAARGAQVTTLTISPSQWVTARRRAAADAVTQLGFGPTFQRMWNLYLACSAAGFRAGYLDVHQFLLERGWRPDRRPRARTGAGLHQPASRRTLR